jgi:hypothetical protein
MMLHARGERAAPTQQRHELPGQDRYVMITFPASQIQNPGLPRRPSIRHGGARANMPLSRQRCHRSSWLTADSRTCDRPIMRRNVVSQHTHRRRLPFRRAQASIALGRSLRYRLPFPAGSFIEGFRTPATVQAASLRSAGIRNPQQQPTFELKEATN